jgi:hypothetical protein
VRIKLGMVHNSTLTDSIVRPFDNYISTIAERCCVPISSITYTLGAFVNSVTGLPRQAAAYRDGRDCQNNGGSDLGLTRQALGLAGRTDQCRKHSIAWRSN